VKVEGLILSLCWGTKVGYQADNLQMKLVGSKEAEPFVIVTTERLVLRRWRQSDRKPFARLNADPRVMEFMPAPLSEEESDLLVDRINAHFLQHGFGLCAVELRRDHSFIGFIGLAIPSFQAKFTPCVEIGWRLSADYWGQGLAIEGSRQMVRYAFEVLGLEALVSFTVPGNLRSRRVMEKLGMTRNPADDFDHPNLPEGHPLRRHVLYRLLRSEWARLPQGQTALLDRSS
jgi:RimJ/RimL family protein N-acetyltransferase